MSVGARSAEQVDQERFDNIVSMVAEEDRAAAPATRHLREKRVARRACRCFDRLFRLSRELADIGSAEVKFDRMTTGEPLDEPRVTSGAAPAQPVVEVADDKLAVAESDEPVQEGDRIAPSRYTDEITLRGRKLAQ